jgi:hypothetical protein
MTVTRIAIIATLKHDGYERAQELLKEGPPSDFLQPKLRETVTEWRSVIDAAPRIAREVFYWEEPRH